MKKIFNDKRFKYGTYSTVITLVILAILVAVNLVAGEFDYKIDLSEDSVFPYLTKQSSCLMKLMRK